MKTVIFCIPGSSFSGGFLECWTKLYDHCLRRGIRPILSRQESCNIYYVRNMCLGGDVQRGKDQKPFDGKINYDYLMWVDSDIHFTPGDFDRLIEDDKDIVSGLYLMDGGSAFAAVREWDGEYFKRHGAFQFFTPGEALGLIDPIEMNYTGMGFMLVKRGVFEAIEYPWFRQIEKRIGDMVDCTMEDVSFCLRAREKGYKIWIDPKVWVGHEKRKIY
jgi:hypothetical protein